MLDEKIKLENIKFTLHHFHSGEINDGAPITTSVEIDFSHQRWNKKIVHAYYKINGDRIEIKENYSEKNLENSERVIPLLENIDLKNLKNNYFSDFAPHRYCYWELEYNNMFKIVGTFDNKVYEIEEIQKILDFEVEKDEELSKVKGIIDTLDNNITQDEVNILNCNSYLPAYLLSSDMNVLETKGVEGLKSINNFMSKDYFCDDFTLKFAGYPTDEDVYKLNQLTLLNDKYNFLEIEIGKTTLKKATEKLIEYGFVEDTKNVEDSKWNNKKVIIDYKKKNCIVMISYMNNIVSKISIYFESLYLNNILY